MLILLYGKSVNDIQMLTFLVRTATSLVGLCVRYKNIMGVFFYISETFLHH